MQIEITLYIEEEGVRKILWSGKDFLGRYFYARVPFLEDVEVYKITPQQLKTAFEGFSDLCHYAEQWAGKARAYDISMDDQLLHKYKENFRLLTGESEEEAPTIAQNLISFMNASYPLVKLGEGCLLEIKY